MHLPGHAPTPAQTQQLSAYAKLLRQWNPKINLVAPSTLPDLETRHIADSAQLAPFITQHTVLDVGSGGGLPGIVLAILCPTIQFTLAERDQRKAAFLLTARHALGLTNVQVHAGDVTALAGQQFGIITARAWASLSDIVALTAPLLAPNGSWLLLKGEAVDAELKAYPHPEKMTFTRTPSITNSRACILHIRPARAA